MSDNEVLSICARVAASNTSSSNVACNLRFILDSLSSDVSVLMNDSNVISTLLYDNWKHALSVEDSIHCNTIIELLDVKHNILQCPLSSSEVDALITFLSVS